MQTDGDKAPAKVCSREIADRCDQRASLADAGEVQREAEEQQLASPRCVKSTFSIFATLTTFARKQYLAFWNLSWNLSCESRARKQYFDFLGQIVKLLVQQPRVNAVFELSGEISNFWGLPNRLTIQHGEVSHCAMLKCRAAWLAATIHSTKASDFNVVKRTRLFSVFRGLAGLLFAVPLA